MNFLLSTSKYLSPHFHYYCITTRETPCSPFIHDPNFALDSILTHFPQNLAPSFTPGIINSKFDISPQTWFLLCRVLFWFSFFVLLERTCSLFLKNKFYWGIVDLPCCVNFCCTTDSIMHIDTSSFIFFSIMVYPRILNIVPYAI